MPGGGFSDWQCQDHLTCQQTDERLGDTELGKCFPSEVVAGDPCVYGRVSQEDRLNDSFINSEAQNCGNQDYYSCSQPSLGHPAGTCTATLSEEMGRGRPKVFVMD